MQVQHIHQLLNVNDVIHDKYVTWKNKDLDISKQDSFRLRKLSNIFIFIRLCLGGV